MRLTVPSLSACALLISVILPTSSRAGQAKPYKGTFDFAVTSATPQPANVLFVEGSLAGHETHLGQFSGEVEYYVYPDGSFSGTLTKAAANGDALALTLTGQFVPTGSQGQFTFTGGTGRFESATGSGTFQGQWVNYLFTAVIEFSGTISYDASDRRR
jgi:hypothetical protein